MDDGDREREGNIAAKETLFLIAAAAADAKFDLTAWRWCEEGKRKRGTIKGKGVNN